MLISAYAAFFSLFFSLFIQAKSGDAVYSAISASGLFERYVIISCHHTDERSATPTLRHAYDMRCRRE